MNIGKVSESVLKRSVLKYVQQNNEAVRDASYLTSEARVGADCALFAISETDFNIGSATAVMIGRRRTIIVEAIINACNNLICSGAEAFGVELGIVLPEAVYESELKHMMQDAKDYADTHQIAILGGHTTVSGHVTETVVTVTALGHVMDYVQKPLKPGMDIVMSKWIGLQGTAQIAALKREVLEQRLPARFVAEAASYDQYMSVIPEARVAVKAGVCAMHDVSGGGIFRALWELADLAQTGISIDLKKIPVKQETIEVCEVFGLNPYELLSGGALLMVTEDGQALTEALYREGIFAEVIGKLTDNNDKAIVNSSYEGEEIRYLERPKTDEIDKLL